MVIHGRTYLWCDPDPDLDIQESLESNLFKKKKMSQAEKHRGWIRMRNLSNVKIAIQVFGNPKSHQKHRSWVLLSNLSNAKIAIKVSIFWQLSKTGVLDSEEVFVSTNTFH